MKHPAAERGIALFSAIFLLVVLALLGAGMVTFATIQHFGSAQDVQSARALNAARAGLEWGAYVQTVSAHCALNGTCTDSFKFPATAASLADFTVTVTFAPVSDANGRPTAVTRIISTACNVPHSGACPNAVSPPDTYVERQVEMLF